MAFRKKYINEIFGTVLVLSALLSTASAVDCFGKSFHCVNSTHFMICVDLGGGVSQSIDTFLIPCPPPTVCQGNNHFECEFPAVTTPLTTLSNVISDTTDPWEEIVVTTNTPPKNTSTTKEYSEKYMNTVSITTVTEDILTTDTTLDASMVTEASPLNDVNSNLNITEIVSTSTTYDAITGLGLTQTITDNIIPGVAEITTELPQVIPVHMQNNTNETTTDNVTLFSSVTESTVTLNNNDGIASNYSTEEVKNITATSQAENVTSENLFEITVTPDTLLVDLINHTEQTFTTTEESFVTGANPEVTTVQQLLSTDGSQNSVNKNIRTTPEPAPVQNTVGVEQFQRPVFGENFMTESVQNITDNITPGVAEITTELPQVIPVHMQNNTNETTTDNVTLFSSVTESTVTLNNNDGIASNYSTGEVNMTATSQAENVTSENLFEITVKPDTLLVDLINHTEQTFTTITDESFVTGVNPEVTTVQPLLSTDGSQNSVNKNIWTTTPEPATVQNTVGVEQFQRPVFGEIFLTESVQNLTTEKPIVLPVDIVENGPTTDVPITTYQSSVTDYIVTSKNVKNEVTVDTTVGSEQPPTTTYEDTYSTARYDVYTTAAPLTINEKQANQNINGSDQVPTKVTDGTIIYMGTKQPTIDINISPAIIDITTEQPIDFTTNTQRVLSTEQSTVNKDNLATEEAQKPIDTGIEPPSPSPIFFTTEQLVITENPSDATKDTNPATESQNLLVTEQTTINKHTATSSNDAITEPSVLPTEKIAKQSYYDTNSLAMAVDTITEIPTEITTVTQKQSGTEQLTTNKTSSPTGNDMATAAIISTTEPQRTIHSNIEQPTSTKSLSIDNNAVTEIPGEFITETVEQLISQQPITIMNSPATGNNEITEASVLPTEVQKPTHKGVEHPTISTNSLPTKNPRSPTAVTQMPINMSTERPTTIKSDFLTDADVATEKATASIPGTLESTKQITEEQKPVFEVAGQSMLNKKIATDSDATAENLSKFTTETPKQLVTDQVTVNENSSLSIDAATEASVLPIYTGTEQPISDTKSLVTDKDVIIENPGGFKTETQSTIYMSSQQPTTNINSLVSETEVTTGKASDVITETQKSVSTSTEQPTTIKNDFTTDIGITTETEIVPVTATIKSTIQIQEEIASDLSDKNFGTGQQQQQQGSLTSDTIVGETTEKIIIPSAKITTNAVIVQSTGLTEQPTTTAYEDNYEINKNDSNININTIKSNNGAIIAEVTQSINKAITTSAKPATATNITEDGYIDLGSTTIEKETTAFPNKAKASDSDIVNKDIITEPPNQQLFEISTGIVDALISTTVKSVDIKKDDVISNAETTLNLANGQQDIKPTHDDKSNTPVIDSASPTNTNSKVGITSAFGITEVNHLNPNTVGSTTQIIVENIHNNQQTTESNLKVTGTEFISKDTTTHNSDGYDVGISNVDTVNSPENKTESISLTLAEEVGEHVTKQFPASASVDLGTITITKLNRVNDSLENSNAVQSGQVFGTEATSETTATDTFTLSLYPTYENSQQNIITSSNQITTENANIVVHNVEDGTATSKTIVKEKVKDHNVLLSENGKVDNTLTSLNTQDDAHVGLATDKTINSDDNLPNNQDPKLSTVNDNVASETVQSSKQPDDLKSSQVHKVKADVIIEGVTENTGTAFAEISKISGSMDFESHISNKNDVSQQVETTTQSINNVQTAPTIALIQNNNVISNPLSNILLDKINGAVKPVNIDDNINSMDILSAAAASVTDDSSSQLPRVENPTHMTTKDPIPSVKTNNNLSPSRLDYPSVTHDLQKTSQVTNPTESENPSVVQPLKETSVPKEAILTNNGNDVTPFDLSLSVAATEITTAFSILEGAKNVYSTIGNFFNTPSVTSTPGNININTNYETSSVHTAYDIQDGSKTSSSIYNIESSVTENNDNLLISKLRPISTISYLPSSVNYNGGNSETTKTEMFTEASNKGNTILNKPVISEALPAPNYKITTNKVNMNKEILNEPQGIDASGTKILKEPYNSVTSYPSEVMTSTVRTYRTENDDTSTFSKGSGNTISIPSDVPSPVIAVNTDTKSLSGQSTEPNLAVSNTPQNNSSFYARKTNAGSKTTAGVEYKNVSQSTVSKSSDSGTNAANVQSYSKSQTDSVISSGQITGKVRLVTNTTVTKPSEIIKNTLKNSTGSWKPYQGKNTTVTVPLSKNTSTLINKNESTSIQNSTNPAKSNTQGNLKPQQKVSTNPPSYIAEPAKPTTSKHPVTITTLTPTTKIITTTTTQTPIKQIPKTTPVNYSCINGIRGRYSDKDDCRKFYICIGNSEPIVGNCPANTVFSDISKLCTKNLSHCIRENEFKCPSAGRFSDVIKDNVYYICVSYKSHLYRFKFQCQKGFTLNKATIHCVENKEIESNESASISLSENSSDGSVSSKSSTSSSSVSSSSSSGSSVSSSGDSSGSSTDSSSDSSSSSSSGSDSSNNSDRSTSKSKKKETKEKKESKEKPDGDEEDEVFECEKEGKFPVRDDCRRYYLCKKNGKSEYRRKIKKCESGDVFHKGKKNCENSNESNDSEYESERRHSNRRQRKERKREPEEKGDDEQEVFQCEREGKFPIPGDCRGYYLCKRTRKSEYRRKIKKCDSDEVFHKSKKKCVDADSYEC